MTTSVEQATVGGTVARGTSGAEGLKAAATLASQIVTLSSGLIGLTVTFVDKFSQSTAGPAELPLALKIAWLSFAACVLCGIVASMAATGSLNQIDRDGYERNEDRTNVKLPSGLMLLAFLVGISATVWAGWTIVQPGSVTAPSSSGSSTTTHQEAPPAAAPPPQ